MIFILSDKENKTNNEIIEILSFKSLGLTDNQKEMLTVVAVNSTIKIKAEKGIVIVTDRIKNFKNQQIPKNFLGICSENNKNALKLFKANKLSVITCGIGNKNTISISSIAETDMLFCLQRSINDINGNVVLPCEIKVKTKKEYNLFCLLSAVAVMFYHKIKPDTNDGVVL